MLLSLILIIAALYWLMRETHYLTIRLAIGSIAVQCIEPHKHSPKIEPCRIINAPYPKAEPIKLISQYCYLTRIQNEMKGSKYKIDYQQTQPCRHESYQVVYIGGHSISLLAISDRLYDLIGEFQKAYDGKTRNESISKLRQTKEPMTVKMIYNPDSGNDEPHYESNCLFPIEWLKAHINDVIPEPTIDLVVNGNETHFNGNYRTGCVHDFMVLNAELWEKPRIRGRKVKPIESVAPVENKEMEEVIA